MSCPAGCIVHCCWMCCSILLHNALFGRTLRPPLLHLLITCGSHPGCSCLGLLLRPTLGTSTRSWRSSGGREQCKLDALIDEASIHANASVYPHRVFLVVFVVVALSAGSPLPHRTSISFNLPATRVALCRHAHSRWPDHMIRGLVCLLAPMQQPLSKSLLGSRAA
jgi:hypothetical protein